MRAAMAFEWAKLRSVRSTWWCFGVAAFLQLAYAVLIGLDARLDFEDSGGPSALVVSDAGLLSIQFAQYALIAAALLAVTSEYSTGTISLTLRAVPVRGRMLAAKTLVVALAVAVAGAVLQLVGSVVAGVVAGSAARWGIGDLATDTVLAAVYAAMLAVFALGLGAALRSAVGGLTAVLVIAVVLPTVLARISIDAVQSINDYLPGTAGVAAIYGAVSDVADGQPYGPMTGVLVLAGWAAAMVGAGYAVLRTRDA
ncbi:ABC transporter permease [Cryptosporangium sp. NPDC048952]|uniref:ABC transporter permease n=1 Tax=Cryptosporangium sp. NPDC048952 TaxID=3363961 RepID=UPI00371F7DE0